MLFRALRERFPLQQAKVSPERDSLCLLQPYPSTLKSLPSLLWEAAGALVSARGQRPARRLTMHTLYSKSVISLAVRDNLNQFGDASRRVNSSVGGFNLPTEGKLSDMAKRKQMARKVE